MHYGATVWREYAKDTEYMLETSCTVILVGRGATGSVSESTRSTALVWTPTFGQSHINIRQSKRNYKKD